jgi:hypothetical protein
VLDDTRPTVPEAIAVKQARIRADRRGVKWRRHWRDLVLKLKGET